MVTKKPIERHANTSHTIPSVYDLNELQVVLKVTRRAVLRLIDSEKLPYVRLSKRTIRVLHAAVAKYLAEGAK